MDTKPKLSVLMPVYNAEKFLHEAIQSILTQSFTDFEFLIFNDGSTDDSKKILESYDDPRIRFFDDPVNKGYVDRLNQGIDLARGDYIARMDADDISMPDRFKAEIEVLDKNKEIGMVGSSVALIDEHSLFKKSIWSFSAASSEIPTILLFTNYFAHPTVMYRTEIARKIKYDKTYMPAEDFKLWTEIHLHAKSYNIRRPLLFYRQHSRNTAFLLRDRMRLQDVRILGEQLERIGIKTDEAMASFHASLSFDTNTIDSAFMKKTKAWYEELFFANHVHKKLNEESLGYALIGRWAMWSKKYDRVPWPFSRMFWSSDILRYFLRNPLKLARLACKALARAANNFFSVAINNYELAKILLWKKKYLAPHLATRHEKRYI